jgi:hypothetical protein
MAFKLGSSSLPDERFGFETDDGSMNSRFCIGFGFMVKKIKDFFLFFYKRNDTRYEDELGLKKITIVPLQRC